MKQAEKLMDTLADEALKIYSTGAVAGTFMLGSTLIDMVFIFILPFFFWSNFLLIDEQE